MFLLKDIKRSHSSFLSHVMSYIIDEYGNEAEKNIVVTSGRVP